MNGQKTYPRCAYKETIEKSVVSIRPIFDHSMKIYVCAYNRASHTC